MVGLDILLSPQGCVTQWLIGHPQGPNNPKGPADSLDAVESCGPPPPPTPSLKTVKKNHSFGNPSAKEENSIYVSIV